VHTTRANLQQPDNCVPIDARNLTSRLCLGLCVFLAGWIVGETVFSASPDHSEWLPAALTIAAAAATLISLSRSLPWQSVLSAATMIGVIGGFVQAVGMLTGVPTGPFQYTTAAGPRFFGTLPWWIPVIWIIAVLNSRGTARLMLRSRRNTHNYGFWLIGVTIGLCLVFDFGLEMFATMIKGYCVWSPSGFLPARQTVPPIHFLIQAISVLAVLVVVTPLLINKKPVEFPPDCHPLLLWMLLNLVFLTGAFAGHFRLAAGLISGLMTLTGILAMRGAKR
jgi:uncharacterized membrane protein